MEQQTLAGSFSLEGVGIHTGAWGRIIVHPTEANTGRLFRVGTVNIPARADYVVDTARCTTLGAGGAKVSTVEHLLSALHGFGIDNAIIEVEGPEIPILDGSALPFAEAIQSVGVQAQGCEPNRVVLPHETTFDEGGSLFQLSPCTSFGMEVVTEFADWPEGYAAIRNTIAPEAAKDYAAQIAPARTFAFRREVEMLLAAGLAKGGSLDNALIITPPDGFSTPLRLPLEWAAHKALDVIGDLALVDARLQLNLIATRPGHKANTRLAQRLLEYRQAPDGSGVA